MSILSLQNPDLERDILAAFILFPEEYSQYARALSEDDFTAPLHKKIFTAIRKLVDEDKAVDPVLIMQDAPEVVEFIEKVPAPGITDIKDYIEELKRFKIKRQLNKLADSIKKSLAKSIEVERIISEVQKYLQELDVGTDDVEKIKDVITKVMYELEKKEAKRTTVGIVGINDMYQSGEMTVIGARPGVGKTAFALKIAYNLAKEGKKVYFISREMTNEQLVKRLLAKVSGVSFNKIRNKTLEEEDWSKLTNAMVELSNLEIYMDCKTSYIEDIYLKIATMKDVDCLIIDYLQLLKTREKTQNRDREIGDITRTLKIMNLDLGIPIFVLSQLNREGEKEPTLRTLRESGNIEQDFDNVIFLHWNEKEQEKFEQEGGHINMRPVKLIVAKHRNGRIGKYKLFFEPERMEFYEEFK